MSGSSTHDFQTIFNKQSFMLVLVIQNTGRNTIYIFGSGSIKNVGASFCTKKSSGADFTKGLKSRFRLKSKTLVLNFVKKLLSLWS